MTIQEKTPRERAALQFKAAGLGERSAVEAARLMFQNGLPFESAAVLGQRLDEASSATPASIREAATRYRVSIAGPRTTTAWGRPIAEAAGEPVSDVTSEASAVPPGPGLTRLLRGLSESGAIAHPTEESKTTPPRTSAWGRPITKES